MRGSIERFINFILLPSMRFCIALTLLSKHQCSLDYMLEMETTNWIVQTSNFLEALPISNLSLEAKPEGMKTHANCKIIMGNNFILASLTDGK